MKSEIRKTVRAEYLLAAFMKFAPATQIKNPVMFLVYLGAGITSCITLYDALTGAYATLLFSSSITLFLWLTVYFANLSESIAEARGKAQASNLRQTRQNIQARLIKEISFSAEVQMVEADTLRKGDLILITTGDQIPTDGEVVMGVAAVDESAITGESAPVVREAGGDRSSVTGGTRVISDQLIVRVAVDPGDSFLDQMIAMVEGARRQKTPNELALMILLVSLTIVFVAVCATLFPFSAFSSSLAGGQTISVTVLIALFVCLAPTTIGGLVSAIGIAGMNRLHSKNIIALSGRAVEAAGDVDSLLLDKTGTITFGNRQAVAIYPAPGISNEQLAQACYLSSMADETPEGKSIVALTKANAAQFDNSNQLESKFVPFSADTRMSGLDCGDLIIRKGAADAIRFYLKLAELPAAVNKNVERIARAGGTPLLVCENQTLLGAIELKDIIKPGIVERFSLLRRMGIRTIMITGDNPLTAASIAAEAGVDEFLAEATPERKLALIRTQQAEGYLVAMMGDGTNDAPALAQADVAIAMNSGTQAAKEAANMIDLDSDPTKLIDVVETGKQLLITRGALTTFSIANDVAKYFAIIPAAFVGNYPALRSLDVMQLGSPASAILSAVVFNAVIIPLLIPLAMRGVQYTPQSALNLLKKHLFVYGLGGLILPFIGIKLIDQLVHLFV